MLRIRIVAAGALFSAFLLVLGMPAGSALAQTATDQAASRPLQLLKIVESKKTKTTHARHLARSGANTKVAARNERRHHHRIITAAKRRHAPQVAEVAPPAPPASAPAPVGAPVNTAASIWPAVNPAVPTEVAAAQPAPATSGPAEPPGNEVVVDGQKVQVASPNEVNEIDLAANDHAAQANDAAPAGAASPAASNATPTEKPISMKAAPTSQHTPIGSASWIMQVLAALGGALTAGSVAWFLIGATPQRTYG